MALTKRSEKGVSLTYTEMDANFTHLGGDGSYQFPATDGTATHVLATDGNGQLSFVPQTGGGGGGIALTDLSVTTGSASGSGSLSYNSTTGAFTFASPDLSTYLTTVAFSDLTGKPTTIAGYGITDAFDGAFSSLTGKPTTISGYGITDAFDGAFSSLTGKPTTISGYGITDAFDGATSSLTGDIDLATQVTGILPVGNMAATALTTVQTAANESAQLALTTEEGDVVVRSDEAKTYMHNGGSAGTMADFTLLSTPTDSVTSVDGNTGAVTTLQLGTSSTTALAGDTTFAFSDITSKPTTISGYGITDALAIGTSSTTAMAGDTTFAFADITSKPTTIAGYGITDSIVTSDSSIDAQPIKQLYTNQAAFPAAGTWHGALAHSHSDGAMFFAHGGSWVQLANNSSIPTVPSTVSSFTNDSNYLTTVAFADLTGKPTTISGYGITDALAIGTSSTTAMAGDTTFAFADITSKPTTISGYGITDALAIGTTSTTALAGNTTFAFSDITSTPTTISGYGITDAFDGATSSLTGNIDLASQVTGTLPVGNMAATALTTVQTASSESAQLALTAEEGDVVVRSDENKTYMHNGGSAGTMADFTLLATPTDAVTSVDGNTGVVTTLQIGTSGTTAMAGNTTFAFADITSKPTTISGYGITDALELGTTSSTALAGDTALLELGTSSTTALAGNTTSFGGNASTVTLGTSTGPQTINIQAETPSSGQNQFINIGTGGSAGSSKTINIGTTTTGYHTKNINMGNSSTSSGTSSNITMYGTVLMDDATVAATHTIGGTTQTGTITIGRSTQSQTINIGTGTVASSKTKTINIGTGNSSGAITNINIGPTNTSATRAIDINGNLTVDGTTQFDHMVTFKSDASTANVYDQIVSFQAKGTSTSWYEAARIATLGSGSAPSRMIIGQDNAALTFFDGFGSRYVYPAHADTGAGTNGVCDLGSYSARFKLGRFSSGTTTSSDRNEKRDIEELTAAELRVAVRCKPLLRKYRRIDAYEEKGEAARIHFGIIAQDLDDAFTAEGLDAHRYAMFMEDTWYEYEGGVVSYPTLEDIPEEHRANATEHTAMGVRYEQLLAFMIAAL